MFCKKCGQELPDYAVYCLRCGDALNSSINTAPISHFLELSSFPFYPSLSARTSNKELGMEIHNSWMRNATLKEYISAENEGDILLIKYCAEKFLDSFKLRKYKNELIKMYSNLRETAMTSGWRQSEPECKEYSESNKYEVISYKSLFVKDF